MAAGAYVVSIDGQIEGRSLRNGVDCAVVYANSTADAQALAEALYGYTQPAVWAAGTATLAAAAANLSAWQLHIQVVKVSDGSVPVDVLVKGDVTNDTIDEIAALAVIALNATAPIANAAYNSSTQVLTVASAADNIGDHELVVSWSPQGAPESVAVPGFVTAHSDLGIAGAALTVTFAADGYTVPAVVAKFARS